MPQSTGEVLVKLKKKKDPYQERARTPTLDGPSLSPRPESPPPAPTAEFPAHPFPKDHHRGSKPSLFNNSG